MRIPLGELATAQGSFDLARWRSLVAQAARTSGAHDSIVPFGFELLGSPRYLRGRLGRFHVYLGFIDNPAPRTAATARSLLQLLIMEVPAFYRTIDVIWGPTGPLYVADRRDGSRPVGRQVCLWPVPGRAPLLPRWADYLTATPQALLRAALYESDRAATNHHALRYLLQLGLMHEAIFEPCIGHLSAADKRELVTAVRELEGEPGAVTPSMLALLHDIVLPYAALVVAFLEHRPAAQPRPDVVDFHGGNALSVTISQYDRDLLRTRVAQAYEAFPTL
jgi:hypothetical protein